MIPMELWPARRGERKSKMWRCPFSHGIPSILQSSLNLTFFEYIILQYIASIYLSHGDDWASFQEAHGDGMMAQMILTIANVVLTVLDGTSFERTRI